MQAHDAASLHPEPHIPAMGPVCHIRAGDEGGAHVIHVRGELDLFDCPRLDQALTDAENSPAALVVLNCEELQFIDAAGLHSFNAASLRSARGGDRLRITRGGKRVSKLFELSGLDSVLPLIGADE